jgi:3-hydroxyisobutyrate dehydrogenase
MTPDAASAQQVAVHGVGRMGLPIAANLVASGHHVRAWDVRAGQRSAVEAVGARWSAALDGVDVLVTVLPGSPELRAAVLRGPNVGLLDELDAGADWLDLTSAAPDLDTALAERARARGIGHLDCGLGGGPAEAERGALTLYVGGEDDVLARRRPVLEAIADPARIHHLGAAGTGHLAKLLVNLLWFAQAVAVGETLLLGRRNGIAPGVLADALRGGPADSGFVTDYVPRLLAGDLIRDFGIDRVVEELDSLERLAHSQGLPFELSSVVARVHRAALADFGPVGGELLGVAHLARKAGGPLSG